MKNKPKTHLKNGKYNKIKLSDPPQTKIKNHMTPPQAQKKLDNPPCFEPAPLLVIIAQSLSVCQTQGVGLEKAL